MEIRNKVVEMKNDISKWKLIKTLYKVLKLKCWYDDENYAWSGGLSAYADGLRLLSKVGLFKIESEYCRSVTGKFKELKASAVNIDVVDEDELIETLYWVLCQSCIIDIDNNIGESFGKKAYASGLRLLSKLGLFEIESEQGDYIIGRFKKI